MNAPVEFITRRAPLAATSWNPDERTFEVVFSTGATVERQDARGPFLERLSLNQDWAPFIGAPVLNSHRRGILTDVLGSVLKAWTVGGNREARAIIRMSRRPDVETIIQDVLDGHLRGVSVGYTVFDWTETTEGGQRVKTAMRWTPAELSIVPIPADRQATIRGVTMTAPTEPTNPPALSTPPAAAAPNLTASAERAAVNAQIRTIASLAGLDQAWTDGQIDAGATAEAASAAAFAAMQARSAPLQALRGTPPTITILHDHTDPVAIRSAMADAIAHRINPGRCKLEGRAREYVGYRTLNMVGTLAHARGDRVNLNDQHALIERAVGAHSTGDFPLLLADAANKSLLANYQAAEPTYRAWAARRSFNDFKPHNFLRVGDFPRFKEIGENGEVKYGTISENREQVSAKEYNAGISIGYRAMANDDLSAVADFSSMIAIGAAADENRMVYALLTGAPLMSDSKALFHADHGNLVTGSAINGAPQIHASVSALRKQKSLDGLALNLSPRFLIVGPDMELGARQVVAAITATKSGDVNPWAGTMELIVDANIVGNGWYIAADPTSAPCIVYGYVAGAEGPQIRTEIDFNTRAVKVAAGLDFGCGVIDFRGLVKNPGA
ncbi:Mu-like prophage major head subunit gpT family protein [Ancylobacter sp. WKF20]|uniref:prohead protease/major capsid protein fusion protein n=1 Tax=Ancylobacter sp. WKF20 TaxID=3039801 RepID=UPI0024341A06|nr:prohead protease/major capsid protein fusion protein [Ancylobacter sp. WKF20]WGD30162.1 Mu-like prophage major head subunit gpT family protein [Ancylobacter sp. WKF20]